MEKRMKFLLNVVRNIVKGEDVVISFSQQRKNKGKGGIYKRIFSLFWLSEKKGETLILRDYSH